MTKRKIYYEVFYNINCNYLHFIQSILEVSGYSVRNMYDNGIVENEVLIERAKKLIDYWEVENFDLSHFIYKTLSQNKEILTKYNIKYFRLTAIDKCDYIFNNWEDFKYNIAPLIIYPSDKESSFKYKIEKVSTMEEIHMEAKLAKQDNELKNNYENAKTINKQIIESQNFISNNKIKLLF